MDQPSCLRARPMLHVVTCTWNSSHRKIAISSRYRWGFSSRWSQRALSITGVSLRGRPPLFGGAFTSPKRFMLVTCLVIVLGWQPAALAIWEWVSSLLKIISRINSRVDEARMGAIFLPYEDDRRDLPGWNLGRFVEGNIHVVHVAWRIRGGYRLCKILCVMERPVPCNTRRCNKNFRKALQKWLARFIWGFQKVFKSINICTSIACSCSTTHLHVPFACPPWLELFHAGATVASGQHIINDNVSLLCGQCS